MLRLEGLESKDTIFKSLKPLLQTSLNKFHLDDLVAKFDFTQRSFDQRKL